MWNPFNRNTISNSSASKRSLQLITQKGMPFAYVEAYKALRTNLNFLSGSGDVHAFVVTSTVPEEAKSNVSVNLALALTESGKKVVLSDRYGTGKISNIIHCVIVFFFRSIVAFSCIPNVLRKLSYCVGTGTAYDNLSLF